MTKLDSNKLAALIALIILALVAVISGYRLEIGTHGLRFEHTLSASDTMQKS